MREKRVWPQSSKWSVVTRIVFEACALFEGFVFGVVASTILEPNARIKANPYQSVA